MLYNTGHTVRQAVQREESPSVEMIKIRLDSLSCCPGQPAVGDAA